MKSGMKRAFVFVVLAMGLMTPAVVSASGISTGDQIKITSSSGSLGGGAFSVAGLGSASGTNFLTFCLEINEFISYNTPYYANIASGAVNGGAGGGNPDQLDSKTAYLYIKLQARYTRELR